MNLQDKELRGLNRRLALVAWAAFVVSFFLPAYGENRGWECAIMHGVFWPGVMQGNWLSIHYLLLTLPNLLMLASPFLLLGSGEYARCLSWLRYSTFSASILVWSFLILLLANQAGQDLRVGAYVWAGSFVLLWLSVILPRSSMIKPQFHRFLLVILGVCTAAALGLSLYYREFYTLLGPGALVALFGVVCGVLALFNVVVFAPIFWLVARLTGRKPEIGRQRSDEHVV